MLSKERGYSFIIAISAMEVYTNTTFTLCWFCHFLFNKYVWIKLKMCDLQMGGYQRRDIQRSFLQVDKCQTIQRRTMGTLVLKVTNRRRISLSIALVKHLTMIMMIISTHKEHLQEALDWVVVEMAMGGEVYWTVFRTVFQTKRILWTSSVDKWGETWWTDRWKGHWRGQVWWEQIHKMATNLRRSSITWYMSMFLK